MEPPPDSPAALAAVAAELIQGAPGLRVPILMVDRDRVAAFARRWADHLPHVAPHYAVKADSDPAVLGLLRDLGWRFDAASAREMLGLYKLGVPGDRVNLSHPAKDEETVQVMALYRPWGFVFESEKEFGKLARHGVPGPAYSPVAFARLRFTGEHVTYDPSATFGRSADKIRCPQGTGRTRCRPGRTSTGCRRRASCCTPGPATG